MNDDTQKESISDYDNEWGLDDDSPQTSSVFDDRDRKTSDSDDQFEDEAPKAPSELTPAQSETNSEESENVDVWANASDAQKEAYRRAENEKVAADNRAKLNADKLAERGRELKALRDETSELREQTRTRTEFEQEHETYATDINTMIEQRLNERLPVQEELSQEEVEHETFNAITTAYPTAGDMYNSDSMKSLLHDDPVFKHDGRAVLFSETLHSNNPNDVIAALDYYTKTNINPSPTLTEQSGLESMQANTSRGGQPDMRTSAQMTTREQYDSEWDTDDD